MQEGAVILLIRYPVSVCVLVAIVPNSVFIAVQLFSIVDQGTVVENVGDTVEILVGAVVAGIADEVVVEILLVGVEGLNAVVAGVPHSVSVNILLSRVPNL